MPNILLTNHYEEKPLRLIKTFVPRGFILSTLPKADKASLLNAVGDAEYLLVSGRLKIDKEVMDAAKNIKMIQRTGIGIEMLDNKPIMKKGIPVYVNRGVNSHSVAEHTIMLMLSVLRNLTKVNARMKLGIWSKQSTGIACGELYGKTVGLIGLGNIGKLVSKLLSPFGAKVCYFDVHRLPENEEYELNVLYQDWLDLLQKSDIISLHCPLTEQNKKMIAKKEFEKMKEGVMIINTARGGLIDEIALTNALRSGRVKGAGLDVFSVEPIPKDNPFLPFDNVILTPHISGITYESFCTMMEEAMNNIRLFHEGRTDLIDDKRLIFGRSEGWMT